VNKPILIGISGGSGSGKSHLAKRIQSAFPEQTTIIEQDWYYRDLSNLDPEEAKNNNFDHPSAIEHSLLRQHLDSLIKGQVVEAPDYSYSSHSRLNSVKLLEPGPILILEGLFSLYWPEIRNLLHFKLYLEVHSKTRLERRLIRDVRDRGYTEEQIRASWKHQTLPMHKKFVEPTARFANFVWNSQQDTSFETTFLADLRRRLAKNAKNPK
jgi:uridine kinase